MFLVKIQTGGGGREPGNVACPTRLRGAAAGHSGQKRPKKRRPTQPAVPPTTEGIPAAAKNTRRYGCCNLAIVTTGKEKIRTYRENMP